MRVLVTGGTGFLGGHTVRALLRAGHEVRLLVRDPSTVDRVPVGVAIEVGDMTDEAAVAAAVRGCDAVVHAAAMLSFDPRHRARIEAVNVRGAQTVLAAACAAGCDPVLHVSTFTALLPSATALSADSPVGTIAAPYSRSKAAADAVARGWQDRGAPVVITYPGFVIGPDDPYDGESNRFLGAVLRGRLPFRIRGILPIADAGYVADGHAAALVPGRGPRRYLLTGRDVTGIDLYAELRRLTGRPIPALPAPRAVTLLGGRLADLAQRALPGRLPIGHEQPYITAAMPRAGTDSAAGHAALGIEPPPLDRTLTETITWLVRTGRLPARAAGRLAGAALPTGATDRAAR